MITPVILCGGSGTRLWPLSRKLFPKQFISFLNKNSLFQNTVLRVRKDFNDPIIVCNEEHRFLVDEQLRQIDRQYSNIILEPVGKNTAPAIALAAMKAKKNSLLLILPSDHIIDDNKAFIKIVHNASKIAKSGKLITFGVIPNKAHTGYGYIKGGKYIKNAQIVEKFIEKPSKNKARKYFKSQEYFWNSGIFLFNSSQYLEELKQFRPEIYNSCKKSMQETKTTLGFVQLNDKYFHRCPNESVDYALLENTSNAAVIPVDVGWNDLGSWSSLWELSEKDDNGNAVIGNIITQNTKNSYIRSNDKMVVTNGVENLVITATKDVVMIANKDNAHEINEIRNELLNKKRNEWESHRTVYRPWGNYELISDGENYQVKKITIKPAHGLSLQTHQHRAEHWIIVAGTAKVTRGEESFLLKSNQSTYIPIGMVHSLENSGSIDLELIEIQSGSYLGEDDIKRLKDRYGRE
tara:strand:- start:484 stop:1875 length:1392 start_codon:yes stop_codon:yes gene_type:complete